MTRQFLNESLIPVSDTHSVAPCVRDVRANGYKKGYSIKKCEVPSPTPKTSRSRARDTSDFDAAPSFDAVEGLALRWSPPRPLIKSPAETLPQDTQQEESSPKREDLR